ncbi:MAG TPA: TspO/MBR family protein [Fimbriimonas sp.]
MTNKEAGTNPIISLLAILTLCYAAAFVGSQGAFQGLQGWYLTLARPSWALPVWLWSPLLSVVSGCLGIAGWLVWRAPANRRRTAALALFAGLVILAGAWPWIFFVGRQLGPAFWAACVQIVLSLAALAGFARVRAVAALLLAPVVFWTIYAAFLSFFIWRFNQ